MGQGADRAVTRVMLDTNVVDAIRDDADLRGRFLEDIYAGRLQFVVTHVQREELNAVPDPDARAALLGALEVVHPVDVSTSGFVLDRSKFDTARLFDDAGAERHRAFVGKRPRRVADALIFATAERNQLPVMTLESKRANLARFERFFPTVRILGPSEYREAER